jgi:hypothetical protein
MSENENRRISENDSQRMSENDNGRISGNNGVVRGAEEFGDRSFEII